MDNSEEYLIQMHGGDGEKKDREPPRPPPPPSRERKRDHEQERPLRESTDIPDLIEPEEGWDRE